MTEQWSKHRETGSTLLPKVAFDCFVKALKKNSQILFEEDRNNSWATLLPNDTETSNKLVMTATTTDDQWWSVEFDARFCPWNAEEVQ